MSYTLVFQGDSITDGNRTKEPERFWDLNHYLGHGYAQMAAARLTADYPEKDFLVHNRGISAHQSKDLYARWQQDTISLRPDILSILVGINDVHFSIRSGITPEDTLSQFQKFYHLMLEETRQAFPQVKFILMEPFWEPKSSEDAQSDYAVQMKERLVQIQQILPEIAVHYDAAYVPLQKKFDELCNVREASYWLWDGVHPTAAGHEILTREWMKAFYSLHIV